MPPQIDKTIVTLKEYETIFLEDFLPSEKSLGGNSVGLWLLESICVNDPGRALGSAKEALYLRRVGSVRRDKSLTVQGRLRYGYALQELQKALLNGREVIKDETLATCQVLTLYEVNSLWAEFNICSDSRNRF